jgi:phage terminase large subunit
MSSASLEIRLPDKLLPLFNPCRYKVLHGGRGSAKSWSVARALITLAAAKPIRVLCARETQKSIQESVHRLLKDQIEAMGLAHLFDIQETKILGKNGSDFAFAGIRQQGVANLKSFEAVDICWVEEAQVVTDKSWDVLIPTIRKPGSEIWITFNPELDDDPTYKRFVLDPPEGAWVQQVNWSDNPWFPQVLEAERLHMKQRDPIGYQTTWEGKCRPAVEGAIYAGEIADALDKYRVCNVPYAPGLKVHVIFDLGWNDSTAIILAQRHLSEIRIIEYIEDSHRTIDWFSAELMNKRLNWGKLWIPHDGKHKNLQTGKSIEDVLRALGWNVGIVPNQSVEIGIKVTRQAFPRVYFDKTKASALLQRLKRYRRNVPVTTNEPTSPLHDENSHGADAFRYMALVADQMGNEELFSKKLKYESMGIV